MTQGQQFKAFHRGESRTDISPCPAKFSLIEKRETVSDGVL